MYQEELDNLTKPMEGGPDEDEEDGGTPSSSRPPSTRGAGDDEEQAEGKLPFPDSSSLNTRFE